MRKPNFIVILIDDLRYDEFGAGGHPYMRTPHTDRYKLIHWVNRGRAGELDELYDLERDPWELKNLIASRAHAQVREKLRRELKRLATEALGL